MSDSEEKLQVLKLLLDHDADVVAKSTFGWTVLHFAAESSALDIVKYLVEEKQAGKLLFSFLQTFHIECLWIDTLYLVGDSILVSSHYPKNIPYLKISADKFSSIFYKRASSASFLSLAN